MGRKASAGGTAPADALEKGFRTATNVRGQESIAAPMMPASELREAISILGWGRSS